MTISTTTNMNLIEGIMNLIEGIQQGIYRAREIQKEYESIPQGVFEVVMIRQAIRNGEQAIAGGDIVAMLAALKELQEIK